MSGRIGIILIASALGAADAVQASEAPKWQPHIDLEGKVGSDRNLGEADFFLPLVQNADSLLFGNLRTRMDNDGGFEGNLGLGVRHMLNPDWNIGAYGYFDRRRSDYGNYFNQITFGGELLGRTWDFRLNGYIPIGTSTRTVSSLTAADFTGSSLFVRGGQEQSMRGVDAEVGWRLPVFDAEGGTALRLYGGGYHFSGGAAPDVTGPRGRLELTFDRLPYLWEGSRFTLGGELQHDDPRGTQGFLSARLRIPLQIFGASEPSRLSAQERRMADPVVRDVDVVTQAGAFGKREKALAADGGTLTVVDATGMTGADMQAALAAAGANSTVVLKGDFDTSVPTVLQPGQTVMGKGALEVRTASGYTVSVQTPGAGITMYMPGFFGVEPTVEMANDSSLIGVTITQLDPGSGAGANTVGIRANGVSNVVIANNTVNVTTSGAAGAFGIRVQGGATNVIVRNNDVTVTQASSNAVGIQVVESAAQISGNTVTAQGAAPGNSHAFSLVGTAADVTLLSGSTGNTIKQGGCNTNMFPGFNINGSIGLTDGTTCP